MDFEKGRNNQNASRKIQLASASDVIKITYLCYHHRPNRVLLWHYRIHLMLPIIQICSFCSQSSSRPVFVLGLSSRRGSIMVFQWAAQVTWNSSRRTRKLWDCDSRTILRMVRKQLYYSCSVGCKQQEWLRKCRDVTYCVSNKIIEWRSEPPRELDWS